jgi:hypothetical protein
MVARGIKRHWTEVAIWFQYFIVKKLEDEGMNELAFRFKTGAGHPP